MDNINHMTPSIEDRISLITNECISIEAALKKNIDIVHEANLYLRSLKLRINELNLMRGIRDGKYLVIEADSGNILPISFHKKEN